MGTTERRQPRRLLAAALLLAVCAGSAAAQPDYGNRLGQRTAGEVEFRPFGTTVVSEHLDPSVRNWYLPQEFLDEYKWRPWETRNYAREPYRRYRSILSEGSYLYDRFGKYLTRGWVIYDWTEERPREAEGSRILPPQWPLSGLNIVSDRKGRHQMRVTIGANIPVTLTPMTFRKSAYDGLLVDYQSDRLSATGLVSRISHPGFANVPAFEQISFANLTSLFGGRAGGRPRRPLHPGGDLRQRPPRQDGAVELPGEPVHGGRSPPASTRPGSPRSSSASATIPRRTPAGPSSCTTTSRSPRASATSTPSSSAAASASGPKRKGGLQRRVRGWRKEGRRYCCATSWPTIRRPPNWRDCRG